MGVCHSVRRRGVPGPMSFGGNLWYPVPSGEWACPGFMYRGWYPMPMRHSGSHYTYSRQVVRTYPTRMFSCM